jgi:hypothetical protein
VIISSPIIFFLSLTHQDAVGHSIVRHSRNNEGNRCLMRNVLMQLWYQKEGELEKGSVTKFLAKIMAKAIRKSTRNCTP